MGETVPKTLVGAWKEAIYSDWIAKPLLILIVAFGTITFLPFWFLLAAIERAGYYDIEQGFLPDSGENSEEK